MAAKSNEYFKNVDEFVRMLPEEQSITGDAILASELLIITSIRFHLYIFEPYSSWNGYRLDLRPFIVDQDRWSSWMDKAKNYLDHILLTTDVSFLYMPSQIALSAVRWAAQELEISMDDYMDRRFGEHKTTIIEITDKLMEIYKKEVVEQGKSHY
jgi:cyclin H